MDNKIDGLWTAVFRSASLAGGGVIYLSEGKVVGGDSQYFYLGTYSYNSENHLLTAQVKCIAFLNGAISVFGIPARTFDLTLSGKASGNTATVHGKVNQRPTLSLIVQLAKRTEKIDSLPPFQ